MFIEGNSLDILKVFPNEYVDCIITSPPYYHLRNYNTEYQIWNNNLNCNHQWIAIEKIKSNHISENSSLREGRLLTEKDIKRNTINNVSYRCEKCGAELCELGLEPTVESYINHLCDIFDECKRVLKPTGTCFVNIDDSYSGSGKGGGNILNIGSKENFHYNKLPKDNNNIKKKSRLLIPERFAIEMIDRGWILRNFIIWKKPNSLPESCTDRFTQDFEYVYMFTKNNKYYFKIQYEPFSDKTFKEEKYNGKAQKNYGNVQNPSNTKRRILESMQNKQGRQMRSVWEINTTPSKEEHFAHYPETLVKRCLLSGCPEEVCDSCGYPREYIYERIPKIGVEKEDTRGDVKVDSLGSRQHFYITIKRFILPKSLQILFAKELKEKIKNKEIMDKTFGKTKWEHWIRLDNNGFSLPDKNNYKFLKQLVEIDDKWDKYLLEEINTLNDDKGNSKKIYAKVDFCGYCGGNVWRKGIVLDPFSGIGTTIKVSKNNNRYGIGIELNEEYLNISNKIISKNLF